MDNQYVTLEKALGDKNTNPNACLACKMGLPLSVAVSITDPDGKHPRVLIIPFNLYSRIITQTLSDRDQPIDVTLHRSDPEVTRHEYNFTSHRYPQFEVKHDGE